MMELWPLGVYFILAVAVVVAMIGGSHVLGQRHQERATGMPYESGILSTGGARLHLSVKYYLVAVFFVIFDLEAAFIFAWAVAARSLGWNGYIVAAVFIGVQLVALAYLWRDGALNWGPKQRS